MMDVFWLKLTTQAKGCFVAVVTSSCSLWGTPLLLKIKVLEALETLFKTASLTRSLGKF